MDECRAEAGPVQLSRPRTAFLLFLGVLILGGLTILPALRSYPRDVATADASIRAVAAAAS